jgi:hypothetical protein
MQGADPGGSGADMTGYPYPPEDLGTLKTHARELQTELERIRERIEQMEKGKEQ